MKLIDREVEISAAPGHAGMLDHCRRALGRELADGRTTVRFAVSKSGPEHYRCELGCLEGAPASAERHSIFEFRRRALENAEQFTAALVIPTGIGCEIGGHSGDAAPVARLLGGACDRLITHPNTVNASDLNEMPPNTLYVEGSILSRVMMGTAGLVPVRANRILTIIEGRSEPIFVNNAINAVNAARGSAGFACDRISILSPRMQMETTYASSGRACGTVHDFERICRIVEDHKDRIDAVAITTVIDVERQLHDDYFSDCDSIVNPWGGVEALLTHGISLLYDLPAAHSPMYENTEIMNEDPGIMDPRLAAEGISVAFLHCVLKGLHKSPRIVTDPQALTRPGVISAEDLSCLVIPDGCIGLPTLAALEQGLPVIAVEGNRNKMENDLTALPWAPGQFHKAGSYLEAAGLMIALRDGVAPGSVRRPLALADVDDGPAAERAATAA